MSTRNSNTDFDDLKPRIQVFGVGGAGGNAVNNMINAGLKGVTFVAANTDAQALAASKAHSKIQLGVKITEGLGAGSKPEIGRAAAEESYNAIRDQLAGAHMVFVTAGMGGGTGTGAAPVVARAARDAGIFTVGVVSTPFEFEGERRMASAKAGIAELEAHVDTLIVIPNQNLFRVADEKTLFSDAFALADNVLHGGVSCITDLMVNEGLINLDFADVKIVMAEGGKAIMGTGQASGEGRGARAAEIAISNPLLDDVSLAGARGLLISITGDRNLTLNDVKSAVMRIRQDVAPDAVVIVGATFDDSLNDGLRVSIVATGQGGGKSREPATPGPRTADLIEEALSPARLEDIRPGDQAAGHFGNPHSARRTRLATEGDSKSQRLSHATLADNIMARAQKAMSCMPRHEAPALGPMSGKAMALSLAEKTGLFRRVLTERVAAGAADSQSKQGDFVADGQQTTENPAPRSDNPLTNRYQEVSAAAPDLHWDADQAPAPEQTGVEDFDEAEVLELPAFLRRK